MTSRKCLVLSIRWHCYWAKCRTIEGVSAGVPLAGSPVVTPESGRICQSKPLGRIFWFDTTTQGHVDMHVDCRDMSIPVYWEDGIILTNISRGQNCTLHLISFELSHIRLVWRALPNAASPSILSFDLPRGWKPLKGLRLVLTTRHRRLEGLSLCLWRVWAAVWRHWSGTLYLSRGYLPKQTRREIDV